MTATRTNENTILNSIINTNDETILPVVRWVCAGSFRDLMTLSSLSHSWNSRVMRYFVVDKSLTERCLTTYVDKLNAVSQSNDELWLGSWYEKQWIKIEPQLRRIIKGQDVNDYGHKDVLEIIFTISMIHMVFGVPPFTRNKTSVMGKERKIISESYIQKSKYDHVIGSLVSKSMSISCPSAYFPFVVMVGLFKNHDNPKVPNLLPQGLDSILNIVHPILQKV